MGGGEGGIIRTWRRGWRVLLVWDGEFRQSKHSSCTDDSTPILYRRRLRSRRQAVAATDKATVVHGRLQRLGQAVTVTGGHGEGGHGEGGPGDWSRRAARRIAGATAPRPRSTATRSSRAWSSASASSASAASSATGGAAVPERSPGDFDGLAELFGRFRFRFRLRRKLGLRSDKKSNG